MKIFNIKTKLAENFDQQDFAKFISKQNQEDETKDEIIKNLIKDVQKNSDKALIKACNKFDGANFKNEKDLIFSQKEILAAEKKLPKDLKNALKKAYKRIKDYHKKQLPAEFNFTDKEGVELGNYWRAIESVGIYAPGGTASYPSSVLMSAVPAIVAGVKEISLCAPTSNGKINPAILYAAKLCGIKNIYKIGGASAIAALTFGTKIVKKVNKIAGPGNSYVAGAKKILFGQVGIDMIAGPTDVTIICDKKNNPSWIAADALSQLEHGPDSKAFIICDDENFAKEILTQINILQKSLPRQEIIKSSLKNSAIIVLKNINDAPKIANFIAPEHLEIMTKNGKKMLSKITNAGAIFLGSFAPESIGDYMAGPSHTLPTSGSAKFSSGLSVFDFLKRISLISCNEKSFNKIAKETAILADCEGLQAHKLAIDIRKK